jgi:hypothetical protein
MSFSKFSERMLKKVGSIQLFILLMMGVDMELKIIFGIEDLVTESAGVGEAARKVDAFYVFPRRQKICTTLSRPINVNQFS